MGLDLGSFWYLGDNKGSNYSLVIAKKDMTLFAEYLAEMLKDSDFEQKLLNSSDDSAQTRFLKFCYSNVQTSREYKVYEDLYNNLKADAAVINNAFVQVTKSLNISGNLAKAVSKMKYAFGSSDWLDNFSDLQQSNSEKLVVLERYNQAAGPEDPFYFDMNCLKAPRLVSNVYSWIAKNPTIDEYGKVQLNGGIELTARYLTLSTVDEERGIFEFVPSVYSDEELNGIEISSKLIRLFSDYKGGPYRMPASAGEKFDRYWATVPVTKNKDNKTCLELYGRIFTNSRGILDAIANSMVGLAARAAGHAVGNTTGKIVNRYKAKLNKTITNLELVESKTEYIAWRNRIKLLVNSVPTKILQEALDDIKPAELKELLNDFTLTVGELSRLCMKYEDFITEAVVAAGMLDKTVPYTKVEKCLPLQCRTVRDMGDFDTTISSLSVIIEYWALVDFVESVDKQEIVDSETMEQTIGTPITKESEYDSTPELSDGLSEYSRIPYPDKAKLKRIQNVARYIQGTFTDCLGQVDMCKLLGTIDETSEFTQEEISQIDKFYSDVSFKIRNQEETAKVFLNNYDNTVVLEPVTTGVGELDAYALRLGDLLELKTASNFCSSTCINILTQTAADKMDVSKYESWKKFIPAQFLPMFQKKFEVNAGQDSEIMQSVLKEQSQPQTQNNYSSPANSTVTDVEATEIREFQQKEQVIQSSTALATEDDILDMYGADEEDEDGKKSSVLSNVVKAATEVITDPLGIKKVTNGAMQTMAGVATHYMDTRADILRADAERQRALGEKQAMINQSKTQNIVAKGNADEQRISARGDADEKRINAAGNATSSVIDSTGNAATNLMDATGHAIDNAGSGVQKMEGAIRETGNLVAKANGIPMK